MHVMHVICLPFFRKKSKQNKIENCSQNLVDLSRYDSMSIKLMGIQSDFITQSDY